MQTVPAESGAIEPIEPVPAVAGSSCHLGDDERECPACQAEMERWAGFYRCRRCGYKESCCF